MSEPIRILHVFGRLDRGGAETMLMNIYRNIDRNKIQFDFIVHTDDECAYDKEIRNLGGRIYHIPRFTGKNICTYILVWNQFFWKHKGYALIHAHIRSIAVLFLFIAKCYGIRTVIHSHNTSYGKGVKAKIKAIISYPLRYFCDFYFACSEEAGSWLFGSDVVTKDNFYILKNAIHTKDFTFNKDVRMKCRKNFNINKKFVIGHVGRFEKQKNHLFLIDIFYEICKKEDNAFLLLAGDGALRKQVEVKTIELGLQDKVLFLGMRNDIPNILQAMDMFLFPSIFEGLGMVLIEAQASGLMCIVSETIPKEAEITDLIRFISLNDSAQHWADVILTCQYERYNRQSEIISAGYEIQTTAKWLEKFYLQI